MEKKLKVIEENAGRQDENVRKQKEIANNLKDNKDDKFERQADDKRNLRQDLEESIREYEKKMKEN